MADQHHKAVSFLKEKLMESKDERGEISTWSLILRLMEIDGCKVEMNSKFWE